MDIRDKGIWYKQLTVISYSGQVNFLGITIMFEFEACLKLEHYESDTDIIDKY